MIVPAINIIPDHLVFGGFGIVIFVYRFLCIFIGIAVLRLPFMDDVLQYTVLISLLVGIIY